MNIAPDKWKHFIVGIGMGAFLQCFFLFLLNLSLLPATGLSLLLAIMISYGFELYSLITGRGHYEIMDAVASVIGGMVGIGIVALF
jgi:glycopeptide antibiotics resistance protein